MIDLPSTQLLGINDINIKNESQLIKHQRVIGGANEYYHNKLMQQKPKRNIKFVKNNKLKFFYEGSQNN